jgi:hypothetical protein
MSINNSARHLEVKYDGAFPTLCRGTLIIVTDDKEYILKGCMISEGTCDGCCYTKGEWSIDWPEDFPADDELRADIVREVNRTIPHGCCGGCM